MNPERPGRRPPGGRAPTRLLLAMALAIVAVLLGEPDAAWAQGVALDTAGRGTEVGLWTARLLNHLALATTVGLLLVPAWLLRAGPIGPTGRAATRTAGLTALLWALSAGAVLVFGLSNAAARPLPEALDGALLGRFLGTRFGSAVAAQSVAALLAAGLAVAARNRSGARLALGVVLLAAAGPAWWGHAGTADLRVAALLSDWLHVAAASVWVGGLVALLVLVVRRRVDPHGPTSRFSSLAGWAILVVATTGVVNVALHTAAPVQLVDTTWGRAALGKALLAAVLGGLGWLHRRRIIPRLRSADEGGAARALFVRLAAVELVVMLGAFGLATTMASGVPANVEAASRIQMFTVPLGEGLVEVSLDPARTGRNELHLYIYDAGRALRPVGSAEVVLEGAGTDVVARLVPSGPGHFTAPAVEVPSPGSYRVRITVEGEDGAEEATGALTVR